MPYVKLDCGMLDSTTWLDREAREVFITALLMAEPSVFDQPTPQLKVHSLDEAGWVVPAGWYGLVSAAGIGIVRRAGIEEQRGLAALERLGSPDPDSRSQDYGGRRCVRVDGGYLILNYDRYRNKDHTAAERSRRYRERLNRQPSRVAASLSRVSSRSVTQAVSSKQISTNTVLRTEQEAQPPPLHPIRTLLPLVRKTLWAPDGKPPKDWTDRREGSVLKQLLTHYSGSQLEVAILGLHELRRGFGERPEWLALGAKCSTRALNHTHAGTLDMMAVATRAYWTMANKRPKNAAPSEPTHIGAVLP